MAQLLPFTILTSSKGKKPITFCKPLMVVAYGVLDNMEPPLHLSTLQTDQDKLSHRRWICFVLSQSDIGDFSICIFLDVFIASCCDGQPQLCRFLIYYSIFSKDNDIFCTVYITQRWLIEIEAPTFFFTHKTLLSGQTKYIRCDFICTIQTILYTIHWMVWSIEISIYLV